MSQRSKNRIRGFVVGVLVSGALSSINALAEVTRPSISLVDKFGVNLMNGQVTASLDTVSIGGGMGLSHNISMYTNHFYPLRLYGYNDKFYALSRYTQFQESATTIRWVYRVYDFSGTEDFFPYVNGSAYNGGGNVTTGYTFVAMRDPRHKLAVGGVNREYLDWTKPDGTIVRFLRTNNAPLSAGGRLSQIVYPNGFTIDIDIANSVSTNTGFSLVYQYEPDTRTPNYSLPRFPMQAFQTTTWRTGRSEIQGTSRVSTMRCARQRARRVCQGTGRRRLSPGPQVCRASCIRPRASSLSRRQSGPRASAIDPTI